jgi:hypothetical protein
MAELGWRRKTVNKVTATAKEIPFDVANGRDMLVFARIGTFGVQRQLRRIIVASTRYAAAAA